MRLEKLIEETLSTMDPVEVPEDLHFDAAKIMRLAKMQEEEEAARAPAPVSFLDRMRETFRSRSWTRYAVAAAAFVVVLGIYGMTRGGSDVPPVPGSDPGQIAVIDDPTVPTTPPDDPVQTEDPVQSEDPVTPEVPDEPQQPEDPETVPAPVVTPQQPTQSAQNPPKPKPPAPKPPAEEQTQQPGTETEGPDIVEEPVEEEPDEVDNPTEYAGGNEIDPDEEPQNPPEGQGEEPAGPEEPGEEPDDPEENIYENMLTEALQDEEFAADFAAEDKGFGHNIRSVEDVPDGTEFMVYFYENEEEAASGTVNEDDIRSILWKKESL